MSFCPDCDTYLTTKISPTSENPNKLLSYYCNNCGFTKNVDISKEPEYKCVYQTNYNNKMIKINQKNIQYLKYDPTVPHVGNIPCPNPECSSKKENSQVMINSANPIANQSPNAENTDNSDNNDVLYIKLNESDLTFLYQCCKCDHTWTNK